jgi:hypothetical protein
VVRRRAAHIQRRLRHAAAGQAQSTSLSIRVQPMNAEVFIDGERWESSGEDRLVVQVAPGTHHVECAEMVIARMPRTST